MNGSFKSPLVSRYADPKMAFLFSPDHKYAIWRKLWIALAKGEAELGLPIRKEQIQNMEEKIHEIDFSLVETLEKKLQHDVMAHIHAFEAAAPLAKGVIHLGATSCFVTDNGDLIQMREALLLLKKKLLHVLEAFSLQARKYAHTPCLSYTHLQPAQPTTVGKRICLWIQDLLMDLQDLNHTLNELRFLGVKGATGTQSSFLSLFEGDSKKVVALENFVAKEMGFSSCFSISGQTYTRKQDVRIFNTLSSIAISAHKFGTDLRLLAHMKEMEEPFLKEQVGSSAMPHKRNPSKSERLCGLARYILSLQENPAYTAATQWLERSLDDSVNRRLSIPEAFLTTDAVLNLLYHLASHLTINLPIIQKRLEEELLFLATEQILMAAVKKGKDRQVIHEALREHSLTVSTKWKQEGNLEDLLQKIADDPLLNLSSSELQEIMNPTHFIGRAPLQVEEFLQKEIDPLFKEKEHFEPFSIEI